MASENIDKVGTSGVVDKSTNPSKHVAVEHVNATVVELQQRYVKPGLKGMFQSRYVVLCAFVVRLGGFLFGYDQGVVSIVLVMPQFLDRFPRIAHGAAGGGFWKGLLTAMIELGAFIGAFNQGWIAEKYSRRYSIMMASVVFIVGSIIQTAAVGYSMLIVGRLVAGLGVGMLSMVVPMYISEVSPPEIRGSLLVLETFSVVFGIIVAYWITYGTRLIAGEWSYRLPFLLQILPAMLLGLSVIFIPFSPRWLASKGRDEECLAALCKLRNLPPTDSRVQAEWYDIRTEISFHREVSEKQHPRLAKEEQRSRLQSIELELAFYADCFRRGYWRRTCVGMGLLFFHQFVGINALIYYSNTLFQTMGVGYNSRLILSGVLNITQLIGVCTSLYTLDKVGRRPLLWMGGLGMMVCHVIIAVLVGLYYYTWDEHKDKGYVAIAFLFIYMLIFGMTWGPIPFAVPAEIFPSSIRAKGVAWSTCCNWLANFVIGLITPPLIVNTRGFGAYTFFAVFCGLSAIFTWLFVPETKGRSLEDMDRVFGDRAAATDVMRREEILKALKANEVAIQSAELRENKIV